MRTEPGPVSEAAVAAVRLSHSRNEPAIVLNWAVVWKVLASVYYADLKSDRLHEADAIALKLNRVCLDKKVRVIFLENTTRSE